MSYTFPSANTVLVFNLAGGTETSKIPEPTLGAVPAPATAPRKPAEEAPRDKDAHIGELLAEVDAEAYKIADIPENWNVSVPDETPVPSEPLEAPNCNTEKSVPVNVHQNPNPLALQVGSNGEVPRWKPGSVIKWNYFPSGWPGGETQAREVGEMMAQATLDWNKANIGVTFSPGTTLKECTFVLGFNAARTPLIAEAFFPNSNDLSYVNVYSQGIYSSWYKQLRAVFRHELGHVLGLRHEFAMDPGSQYEGGSVQFGTRDAYSVMNYRDEPPTLTQKDIDTARAFYAYTGEYIGSMPVRDYIPY
ncbi:hypothetical protein GJ744_006818 [Endocarpon pusillum]|uniref:Peptidase metallopeptidase domain-containing protein n=1 Tax=Endocarpon pusillum TaxID=364733 RepID=A0A8H7ANU4_9EURO|nr:hypothetical protein GJ744_006818 [Endocarpon pusillum]